MPPDCAATYSSTNTQCGVCFHSQSHPTHLRKSFKRPSHSFSHNQYFLLLLPTYYIYTFSSKNAQSSRLFLRLCSPRTCARYAAWHAALFFFQPPKKGGCSAEHRTNERLHPSTLVLRLSCTPNVPRFIFSLALFLAGAMGEAGLRGWRT